MTHDITIGIYLASLLAIIIGCESQDGMVGSEIVDSPSSIVTIDTLSINSGTVYLDSVITQDVSRVLFGSYEDLEFGKITAKGFLEILPPIEFFISEDAKYEELTLTFYNDYNYGDFEERQILHIGEVLDDIEPIDEDGYLYSSTELDYEEKSLGSVEFTPADSDSVEITISEEFGLKLFNFLKSEESVVSEEDEFIEFFKGIVLTGENTNSSIVGFNLLDNPPKFVLKYTEIEGQEVEQKEVEFTINVEKTFTNIQGREQAPINQLSQSREYLPSNQTDQINYIQSGVGLVARIDFPTLRAVLTNLPYNYSLMSAELYVKPIGHTYDQQTPLPDSLQLNLADEKNNVSGILEDIGGTAVRSAPEVDEEFNMQTYYRFDIATFIQSEIEATNYSTGDGLIISPSSSDRRRTVDRIMIGSRENREYDMQMRIILLKI